MGDLSIRTKFSRRDFDLDVDLIIPGNGVSVFLGPSGSGKSTLLRILAGLESVDKGYVRHFDQLWLDTRVNFDLPSNKRKIGFVFQDYALFPHLNVAGNIAYGLQIKNRRDRIRVVEKWLQCLHLQDLAKRFPHELSGGQKQRVALARALAPKPDVLLLDEPFSALDIGLRQALRDELKSVIAQSQCPVVMVTHDMQDARCLADNVGVMVAGRLTRFGTASDVFENPKCRVAAELLGWRNKLSISSFHAKAVESGWGKLELLEDPVPDADYISIRPEHVRIANGDHQNTLPAFIETISNFGVYNEVRCRLQDGTPIYLHRAWDRPLPVAGNTISLSLPAQHVRLLTENTPKNYRHPGNIGEKVVEFNSSEQKRPSAIN